MPGIREIAEADLEFILEDSATGFGWPIQVTDPLGFSAALTGFSQDIAQAIDTETQQLVAGRLATVSLRNSSITAAGFSELPRNIEDSDLKPWLIAFDDINGEAFTFKVADQWPDRELGMVTLVLELYDNG